MNILLNNKVSMPMVGLGVYQTLPGTQTQRAVEDALELGCRHIDTASTYGNEADVGRAVRASGIKREDIFVTTKLWNSDQGYDSGLAAFSASLDRLGFDYVDLYLIHWPRTETRVESWRALEKIYSEKNCRAIGVSNYTIRHLEELLAKCSILPAVNQVEFSPFLYQKKLLEFCSAHQIQLEAYTPLTQGKKLTDPRLMELAKKYKKSPAQVVLRWAIQHQVVVIPKSVHKNRMAENFDVFDFEIGKSEMSLLDSLNEDFRACWNPTDLP